MIKNKIIFVFIIFFTLFSVIGQEDIGYADYRVSIPEIKSKWQYLRLGISISESWKNLKNGQKQYSADIETVSLISTDGKIENVIPIQDFYGFAMGPLLSNHWNNFGEMICDYFFVGDFNGNGKTEIMLAGTGGGFYECSIYEYDLSKNAFEMILKVKHISMICTYKESKTIRIYPKIDSEKGDSNTKRRFTDYRYSKEKNIYENIKEGLEDAVNGQPLSLK